MGRGVQGEPLQARLISTYPAGRKYEQVHFVIVGTSIAEGGGAARFVTAVSLIQAITPDHLLGRTNASRRFVVQGMNPLGAFLGGVLGSAIGLRPTIAIGAVGATLAVTPLFVSPLRRVKVIADAEEIVRSYNERFAESPASASVQP